MKKKMIKLIVPEDTIGISVTIVQESYTGQTRASVEIFNKNEMEDLCDMTEGAKENG